MVAITIILQKPIKLKQKRHGGFPSSSSGLQGFQDASTSPKFSAPLQRKQSTCGNVEASAPHFAGTAGGETTFMRSQEGTEIQGGNVLCPLLSPCCLHELHLQQVPKHDAHQRFAERCASVDVYVDVGMCLAASGSSAGLHSPASTLRILSCNGCRRNGKQKSKLLH